MDINPQKEEMKTLASCLNSLHKAGYEEDFVVDEKGLHTSNSDKAYSPSQIRIVDFYRFEGESDPADNAILYAIETSDGVKGTLSDAYGPYADSKVMKFIQDVEEIMKKSVGEKKSN